MRTKTLTVPSMGKKCNRRETVKLSFSHPSPLHFLSRMLSALMRWQIHRCLYIPKHTHNHNEQTAHIAIASPLPSLIFQTKLRHRASCVKYSRWCLCPQIHCKMKSNNGVKDNLFGGERKERKHAPEWKIFVSALIRPKKITFQSFMCIWNVSCHVDEKMLHTFKCDLSWFFSRWKNQTGSLPYNRNALCFLGKLHICFIIKSIHLKLLHFSTNQLSSCPRLNNAF